jgi:hypothetical protein
VKTPSRSKDLLGSRWLPLAFLALVLSMAIPYTALPQANKPNNKPRQALTDAAKNRIAKTLADYKPDSLLLFNLEGTFKSLIRTISGEELANYGSLREFALDKNPIDNCKNPVPSPPCIICDDGKVLCTYAKFSGKVKKLAE